MASPSEDIVQAIENFQKTQVEILSSIETLSRRLNASHLVSAKNVASAENAFPGVVPISPLVSNETLIESTSSHPDKEAKQREHATPSSEAFSPRIILTFGVPSILPHS